MTLKTSTMAIVLLLIPTSLAIVKQITGLYLDRISFWNQDGIVHEPIAGGYLFTFSWNYSLPSIQSTGLALHNFQTGPNKMLSYMTQMTNTTSSTTQIRLTQNIPDAGITYLAFSVMVVTQDNNIVELLAFIRTSSIYGQYNLYSSKFIFESNNYPHISYFLQWTQTNDVSSSSSYVQHIGFYISPVASSRQLKINFSFYSMKGFRVNILLVAKTLVNYSISNYRYGISISGGSSSNFISNFGVPTSDYGQPVGGKRCVIGLSHIYMTFYSNNSYSGSSSILFTFSGAAVSNIHSIYVGHFTIYLTCFGYQCSQRLFPDATNNTCENCSYDCLTCDNATHCLSCSSLTDFRQLNNVTFRCDPLPGYYDKNISVCGTCLPNCLTCLNQTICTTCLPGFNICRQCIDGVNCIQCASLGLSIVGGECACPVGRMIRGKCIETVGCLDFIEKSDGQIECQQCDTSQFNARPVNGTCQCTNGGNMLNGVCNIISGCTAASISPSGEPYCLDCNHSLNLNASPDSNGYCVCADKYENISNNCQEICGDGYLMNVSKGACDDGNLADFDGCSSSCEVEVNYRCRGGSPTSPSRCPYIGSLLSISLAGTEKAVGLNKGIFQISISPQLATLSKMNLTNYVSLDCNANYTIDEMVYLQGILSITTSYTGDMEGRFCNLTVSYDPSIVLNPASSLSFTVKSDDYAFIYESSPQNQKRAAVIFRTLSLIALGIFVISLPLKMTGVELITCIQMVYISLCFYSNPTYLISSIGQLSPIVVPWTLFSKEQDKDLIKGLTDRVELSPFFLESSVIITGTLLVSALTVCLVAFLSLFRTKQKKQRQSQSQDKNSCYSNRAIKLIYNFLLFPTAVGFMLVIVIESYVNNRRLSVTRQSFFPLWANSLAQLFLWMMTAVVCGTQLILPKQVLFFQKQQMKKYYPFIFICRLMILGFLITIGFSLSFNIILYAILTLELFYLLYLIFTKIYHSVFTKIVAIACEVTVIYALSLPVLMRFYVPSAEEQNLMLIVLQGMIVVLELMTIFRVIIGYCRLYASKNNQSGKQDKKMLDKATRKKGKTVREPLVNSLDQNPRKRMYLGKSPLTLVPQQRLEEKRRQQVESQELKAIRQRLHKSFHKYKENLNKQ